MDVLDSFEVRWFLPADAVASTALQQWFGHTPAEGQRTDTAKRLAAPLRLAHVNVRVDADRLALARRPSTPPAAQRMRAPAYVRRRRFSGRVSNAAALSDRNAFEGHLPRHPATAFAARHGVRTASASSGAHAVPLQAVLHRSIVSVERRIADIYRCRTPDEILGRFEKLQLALAGDINEAIPAHQMALLRAANVRYPVHPCARIQRLSYTVRGSDGTVQVLS
jgi:hypothetical protein